jgi:hypothetical protein
MKWTWDKFGYRVPRNPSSDTGFILASLNLLSDQSARVQFFPDLGRAIVTTNANRTFAPSDLIGASRESDWDVEYYAENDLDTIKRSAAAVLTRIKFITCESASILIQNGVLSLDDVSVLPPKRLAAILNIDVPIADAIIDCADEICASD